MCVIKNNLFSRIVFLNNDVLTNLYSAAKEKPTLLKGVFELDKFLEINSDEGWKNLDEIYQNFGEANLDFCFDGKYKIKDLGPKEITLIKSLFYFCNKYDQINYIRKKIKYFKIIKNEIIDIAQNSKNNYNNRNETYSYLNDGILKILKKLYKKRNKILGAYIDIHKDIYNYKKYLTFSIEKQKNQKGNNYKNIAILGYNIDKRFNIIVKLLMEYEINNILGKLIYIDSNINSNSIDYSILRNLKKVQSTFKEINNITKKIKIDFDRRGYNYNKSSSNREDFQRLNSCLSKMDINFLNFINLNKNSLIQYKDMPKLNQMLYKENENFYKKIGFDKTFENLIKTIDYFYDFDNNPIIKLKYCQEILRIFIEVQTVYKNFKEIIPEYFELYYNMIMKSVYSISLYNRSKIGEEEEKTILKLCYYSCESFILIILNSKKIFGELKPYMQSILSKLLKIYEQLKNPKNRIIFQILYTYYISRVLLFISKEKYFDEFNYNLFFQTVYPIDKMHKKISSCIEEISKNEVNESSDEEEEKTHQEIEDNKSEEAAEEEDEANNNIINNEQNENFNYYHNNQYYNNYLKKKSEMKKMEIDKNKFPEDTEISENNYEGEIFWENEEEKEKLSFYLNYFSIYVLYLHERNSIKKIRDNINREDNNNNIGFDFKNLFTKIQKLLDPNFEQSLQNQIPELTQDNTNSNYIKYNLANVKYSDLNNQESNTQTIKNSYLFESVLIEAIILYKYRTTTQNVEIPVKNYKLKNKIKEPTLSNDIGDGDKTSSISNNMSKLRSNNLIYFYYYDNEYIDLIFLEKICNDIHVSNNLNYYCANVNGDISDDNIHEDLLKKILSMKKEFKLITLHYKEKKGEYDKLHDQYLNNDMEEFILLLKNRFTNKDFNRIYSMKKFLYKRMNEIYSEEFFNSESYNDRKILSFIEQFKSIENTKFQEDSSEEPDNLSDLLFENISLDSYLTSLVYIYPTYPKKTCMLYYKLAFQLLAKKYGNFVNRGYNNDNKFICNLQNNQHSMEENDKIIEGIIQIFSREINKNIIQDDEVFFAMIKSLIVFLKEIKENNLYLNKSSSLIRKLFTILDFAFAHLFQDFEKIINFMKSAENQKLKDKYKKNEANLIIIIIFITTFLSLQKAGNNNLLTKNIIELIQNFTGQIIKLVLILIEIGKEDNMKTVDILIDYFYFFIEGPNINNLNSLFSFRFFN